MPSVPEVEACECEVVENAFGYAEGGKELHNYIRNPHEVLRLIETFLVFLFHIGLGKEHTDYILHDNQKNTSVDALGQTASLEYATQRFIQTVTTHPSVSRTEPSLGMVATRGQPKTHVATTKPIALLTIVEPQNRAIEGLDGQHVQFLLKYCQHCKKHCNIQGDCKENNGGHTHSGRRKQSRSRRSPSRRGRKENFGREIRTGNRALVGALVRTCT